MSEHLYVCWLPRPDIKDGTTPWPQGQSKALCQDCQSMIQVQDDIQVIVDGLEQKIGRSIPRVCIPCAHTRTMTYLKKTGRFFVFVGPDKAVNQLLTILKVVKR